MADEPRNTQMVNLRIDRTLLARATKAAAWRGISRTSLIGYALAKEVEGIEACEQAAISNLRRAA